MRRAMRRERPFERGHRVAAGAAAPGQTFKRRCATSRSPRRRRRHRHASACGGPQTGRRAPDGAPVARRRLLGPRAAAAGPRRSALQALPLPAAARHACEPQAPELVLHLKVPKAASTTVFDLIGTLAPKNKYRVNNRPQYLDAKHETRSARAYARYFLALKPRTVRSAHGVYLDFARLLGPGALRRRRRCYFGLVREPTKRLRSPFDYLHWGRGRLGAVLEGPGRARPRSGTASTAEAEREESRGGCLYWANAQLSTSRRPS